MAYDTAHLTGTVVPSGGAYPYGDLVNAPNGTRVNKKMIADMWQFFQRAMSKTNITPNNLPDNNTNGYQLYEAVSRIPYELTVISTPIVSPFDIGMDSYSTTLIAVLPSVITFNLTNTTAVAGHQNIISWVGHSGGSSVTITATAPSIIIGSTSFGVSAGVSGVGKFTFLGFDGTNNIYLSEIF